MDMEALSIINANRGKFGKRFGIFDVFSYGRDSESPCNVDETANGDSVQRVLGYVSNELPVDFQIIDWEALQITK